MTEKFDDPDDSYEDGSEEGSSLASDSDDEVQEETGSRTFASAESSGAMKRAAADMGPVSKRPKLNKAELYVPPTNEELNQLRETENLFKSSLFRMQITELLSEVLLTEKRRKRINGYLETVQSTLAALPEGRKHELSELSWLKKTGVCYPITAATSKLKGWFQALPPENVRVLGSFPLGTSIKPKTTVDIAVQMPQACFDSKDYLNQRFVHKRALYLCCLAEHLRKSSITEDLQFTYHHGNMMKPILVLVPPGKLGSQVSIHVHVCMDSDTFKLNRFHVAKNNIRKQWYSAKLVEGKESESDQPPTPHYNAGVLQELVMSQHAELLAETLGESQGLREGIVLLKVWSRQRQLDQGRGSFGGFLISMLVAYLVQKRKLNRGMSSYQVMRNTLIYLGQSDWSTTGISMGDTSADVHRPTLGDFQQAFDVVFVDPSGYLNLCAHMDRASFDRVRHEAQLSVEHLETPGIDAFEMLLMTPVKFMHKFDQIIHLSGLDKLQGAVTKLGLTDRLMDQCGDELATCVPSFISLLQKAIGSRVKLISLRYPQTPKWSISKSAPQSDSNSMLSFGLLLDADNANSIVDKGPTADSPQAKEFQLFWGEKSELRRFQDSSICEAVVWPAKTLADRRTVTGKIVKHIFDRHANVPKEAITIIGPQVECVLRLPKRKKGQQHAPYGTGEEQHSTVIRNLDELGKILRSLDDLPLAVHSIQGTDPVSRYAEVFPAIPTFEQQNVTVEGRCKVPDSEKYCPAYVPAVTIQCLLEASGKWPEDKDAVQRLRAAFHIKLGQLLRKKAQLTVDIHPQYVNVFKEGYVYRIQIGYLKEISLLKMVHTPDGKVRMLDTPESVAMERELVKLPRLASTLHSLQQQFGSYCSTVRLCKRWLGAQLMGDHVPQEVVEIMAASLFLHPAPLNPPGTPQVGFLRFLQLLGTHDWQSRPLMVDLNREFTKEDYTEIPAKFTKERKTLPLMFLATPQEKMSACTKHTPTAPILQRLILLARESVRLLETQLEDPRADLDVKRIFRPPLEHFDVLLYLSVQQVPRHYQAIDTKEGGKIPIFVLPDGSEFKHPPLPVCNYNPVDCFLKELKESFGDIALFFHDMYGGDVIAVLWKPNVFTPTPFKVSHAARCVPETCESSKAGVQMVANVAAILEDMKIMGAGLLKAIHTKTEKWAV